MRKKSIQADQEAKPQEKSLESWIWDAACSIRGATDAAKYKDYILPLVPDDPEQPVWSVIRKFAEVGTIMSRVLQPEPAMEESAQREGGHSCPPASKNGGKNAPAPLKLFGQEYVPETGAMVNMNMIIHDME